MTVKRIMVDMSATLLHHGHVRLLNKAAEHGNVIVGLTSDEQILDKKGYEPELSFKHRKEILESFTVVSEVVETPWLITEEVLDSYSIDLLVHGDDNLNPISDDRLLKLPRTNGVSSSELRQRALKSIASINNQKLMLTPGPAVVLYENIKGLSPVFGRGDEGYQKVEKRVLDWVRGLSEQDELIVAQGSATFAIELALRTFVTGKVLLVSTGFYSDRIENLLSISCEITKIKYSDLAQARGSYDWVLCAYTETSHAFRVDISFVREKADSLGSRLFADATGSIGLEKNHNLCDLIAFSSCKGLFGLTGASFIAYKNTLKFIKDGYFYMNINTHINHEVTGPYHAIASLNNIVDIHADLVRRVLKSKNETMDIFSEFISRKENQPLLCTYLEGEVVPKNKNIVLYAPRSELPGSIICHFGELHKNRVDLKEYIDVIPFN